MRKAEFAELALSLVTSHERAVSMVGDLLEESGASGAGRFWFLLAQTVVSEVWRQLAAAPLGAAGVATRGIFVAFGLLLLEGPIMAVCIALAAGVARATFHADLPDWSIERLSSFVCNILVALQLGRWMARRYPGGEGTGSVTLTIFHTAINLCAGWMLWHVVHYDAAAPIDLGFFLRLIAWDGNMIRTLVFATSYATLFEILLLVGAASARAGFLVSVAYKE